MHWQNGSTNMSSRTDTDVSKAADPVDRLRSYVAEGGFGEGAKLAPERQLTEVLGLSRSTLREALGALERGGLIWRHVGKDTFVAQSGQRGDTDPLILLGRQLTPFRMMRAHLLSVQSRLFGEV
jgi:DNA-binding FadR family transcriptional regulator